MAKKVKKSSEDKTITIQCAKPNYYLRQMREAGIDEDVLEALRAGIQRELREIDKHMKQDGWDLDFDHVKSEVLAPLVTSWFEWYLMSRCLKRGYYLRFDENEYTGQTRMVVSKRKRSKRK